MNRLALRHTGVSVLNHWIAAMLIVAMWTLGMTMRGAPDPVEDFIRSVHIGLGFFVLWFGLWRIGFRLVHGFPTPDASTSAERIVAAVVQRLLLAALLVTILTGPMYLFTEGEGMDVFGWFTFSIPLPLGDAVHEVVEDVHKICGVYLLPGLIGLHLLGAIRHWLGSTETSPARLSRFSR